MRLILLTPHTHAGRPLLPGERLNVDEGLATWLIEQGVARPLRRPRPHKPAPAEIQPLSDTTESFDS